MDLDRSKLEAAVLHTIWRTSDRKDFGVTKLNKVLWFSDARAFEAFGRPITGETYIRHKHGPVPKHIPEIISDLIERDLIQEHVSHLFDYEVRRYTAYAPPDTTVFREDELGFIDWWIRHVSMEHTAQSISEKSHDYGWKIVPQGEEIPLKAFLANRVRQPESETELDWATSQASRYSEVD